jgi:hypothetical protein
LVRKGEKKRKRLTRGEKIARDRSGIVRINNVNWGKG